MELEGVGLLEGCTPRTLIPSPQHTDSVVREVVLGSVKSDSRLVLNN